MNNKRFYRHAVLFLTSISALYPRASFALKTAGRITLGGVAVTERFESNEFGSTSNDYLLGSSRFFYKVSEYGEDKWEFTTDLRDKHDFFGGLNREDLVLEDKNEFQFRQMSARWLNPDGPISAQFGRFQLPEAGAVFVDGAASEYRFNYEWKTGLFWGFNPKTAESSALRFDEDAQEGGVFATYQSKDEGWNRNLYFTHGLVSQSYKSKTERSYFFHNLIYQWEENSRIISYLNYDYEPTSKMQTTNFIYQQKINPRYSSEVGYLMIDAVEYRRNQGLLERLDASPYSESRLQLNHKNSDHIEIGIELSSGVRQADSLKRSEVALGFSQTELISKNFDLRIKIGNRLNFTSKDNFAKVGMGYFSKKWEYSIEGQYETNANDDGTTTHPLTVELALTNYYSKQIFLMGSFQRAADENVTIMSTFIKVGYRFGNQEIPPVRDGASPRGPL